MTSIKDLELRIKSAESTLEMLRGELEALRQQEQQEPESLLGRWATHPKYGRGIITDVEPDSTGEIEFAFPDEEDRYTRTSSVQATLDEIDLDPATLNGEQEFGKAPVGTIVESIRTPQDVYVKSGAVWYITGDTLGTLSEGMPACRVIRWGNGQ